MRFTTLTLALVGAFALATPALAASSSNASSVATSSTNSRSVASSNNHDVNKQGQGQGQSQGQNQGLNNDQAFNFGGSKSVRQAPEIVVAPANNTAPCTVANGGGISLPWGAASLANSEVDERCEQRARTELLHGLGADDVAIAYLCNTDPQIKAAFDSLHKSCYGSDPVAQATPPAPVAQATPPAPVALTTPPAHVVQDEPTPAHHAAMKQGIAPVSYAQAADDTTRFNPSDYKDMPTCEKNAEFRSVGYAKKVGMCKQHFLNKSI